MLALAAGLGTHVYWWQHCVVGWLTGICHLHLSVCVAESVGVSGSERRSATRYVIRSPSTHAQDSLATSALWLRLTSVTVGRHGQLGQPRNVCVVVTLDISYSWQTRSARTASQRLRCGYAWHRLQLASALNVLVVEYRTRNWGVAASAHSKLCLGQLSLLSSVRRKMSSSLLTEAVWRPVVAD